MDRSLRLSQASSTWAQLQYTTDALPCHIHLPVCLWIMDPHSRAPQKNTSHGNEVLPRDTTHLIQRPCYQRRSLCQDPGDIRPHEDLTIVKRHKLQWHGHVSRLSGLAITILLGTVKGGGRQGRGSERGGKTTSGNGQAWSSPSPREQWRTEKNEGSCLRSHLWCPNDPRG